MCAISTPQVEGVGHLFQRLLQIARWVSGFVTIVAVANLIADAFGEAFLHEGPVWLAVIILWGLTIELLDRRDMRRQVCAEVDKILTGISQRMDNYEMHTLGHLLSDEQRPLNCKLKAVDS
jgi:hypothetical protein